MLKGRLIVGQSGGPTPVINASLAGVIMEAKRHSDITGVYGLVHGIEGALKDELIDLSQESVEMVERLVKTPASALGSCRHKLSDGEYGRILELFRAHNARHFVYIGGNDSMDTCHRVSALAQSSGYELQVMGVPKTVDNDLALTDHCPGYGSAARFLALATRDTGRDMESMATFEDVIVLETMGRNAGWLTAASVLGKTTEDEAPHLVYVPEIPFDEARFLDDVACLHSQLGRVFVVVCEGIRDSDDRPVGEHKFRGGSSDAFGHVLHTLTTGVAAYLADVVSEKLELQARFLRPVLIGRAMSACVAETDRREALRAGKAAVAHLAAGRSGLMVTLERISDDPYTCETGTAPLADVANAEKLLPRGFLNDAGNMVTRSYVDYALPLIDGPLPPLARLKGVRVSQKVSAG
ncbi:MAG: 6-phosphofructokinase [Chloroflexota bacterium]|nr:6-phosphofructokinase [Chloroflexota bacterium]